jgi:hypothetical protein
MSDVLSDGQTLKTLVLSKAARGKFISVHRTIRDLQRCDDYIDEAEGKGSDMELIKSYILGQASKGVTGVNTKASNDTRMILDSVKSLCDRMDKAGL